LSRRQESGERSNAKRNMKQVVVTLCSLSLVGGFLLLLLSLSMSSLSMSLSLQHAAETALAIYDEEAATKDGTASTAVQHGPPAVPSPRSRPWRQLQEQEDDAECACQPARITFQLALDQTCDPTAADAAVATGQIVDYECTIEKLQVSNSTGGATVKNVTTGTGSAVPAVVVSVLILELDANDQIIGQSATNGTFVPSTGAPAPVDVDDERVGSDNLRRAFSWRVSARPSTL
jgi:hypothetical protein